MDQRERNHDNGRYAAQYEYADGKAPKFDVYDYVDSDGFLFIIQHMGENRRSDVVLAVQRPKTRSWDSLYTRTDRGAIAFFAGTGDRPSSTSRMPRISQYAQKNPIAYFTAEYLAKLDPRRRIITIHGRLDPIVFF